MNSSLMNGQSTSHSVLANKAEDATFGMGLSSYCLAWLCDAVKLVAHIEELLKVVASKDLKKVNVRGADALRRLMDRIPCEILNDSICTARCGHYVSALMTALYDAEKSTEGYWGKDRQSDMNFLNRLQCQIREEAYLKAADHSRRVHACNEVSLFNYLIGLKAAYSKIMVIRLDLHFPWHPEAPRATTGTEGLQWEALLQYVKDSFQSFLGYAAKFEVGAARGVHIHTVFVFNGSLVQSDRIIAKMIGDHWRAEIHKGRAGYFNCNCAKYLKRMKWPAVGCFTHADESFEDGMKHLCGYLAKPDPLVKVALPQIGKSLRRSILTEDQKKRIARRTAAKDRHEIRLGASRGTKILVPIPSAEMTSRMVL